MTTETQTQTPTMADKLRATWDAGDYAEVAERLVMPLGPVAVEAAGTREITRHLRRTLGVSKHQVTSLAYWSAR